MGAISHIKSKRPWNKGKLTGQKPPLKLKEIWAIRIRLQISKQVRDLALIQSEVAPGRSKGRFRAFPKAAVQNDLVSGDLRPN